MKRSNFLFATLALVMLFGLSSCNRGVGCPSDFSIADTLQQLLSAF